MSINIKELLSVSLRNWVGSEMIAPDGVSVAQKFWVNPVDEHDPEFKALVSEGIAKIECTRIVDSLKHDALLYVLIEDDSGRKIFISHSSGVLPEFRMDDSFSEFLDGELHFLQFAYLVTRFNVPAFQKIPHSLVDSLPIFEDDLLPYFPRVYVFDLKGSAGYDDMWVVCLKASLLLERGQSYVADFYSHIVEVALSIPSDGHDWIFEQLLTAIQSSRLISFYLELYKIFEFFFPLDSIFKLADRLDFYNSELELLGHCRGALSWNVNHQRGARSALAYATVSFAEICLDEQYCASTSEVAFKERAAEKMTTARHSLTHQDFRSVAVSSGELHRMTLALLVFLQDAFKEYSSRRKERGGRKAALSLRGGASKVGIQEA
ncbi:hypothetical protein [Pseudomonas sp. YuFO8]|uniref:hypothetical protein n=1 Tax=Pseudomonas sp. YuFO8 TaxID=3095361 RepID=UPI002B24E6D1|nr:hypothetical protein [Pseudomonas sp. YuFO8]MEB2621441.1 hypothetical protein [Pseudomonas sp. YuFO8]